MGLTRVAGSWGKAPEGAPSMRGRELRNTLRRGCNLMVSSAILDEPATSQRFPGRINRVPSMGTMSLRGTFGIAFQGAEEPSSRFDHIFLTRDPVASCTRKLLKPR